MPTNFNEGTPRDPNIAKQLNKLYRDSSAPESNTYQASRKKLESSFRAEPSARPSPQVNRQPFTENIYSRSRPKGYEDKATEARQQARREYLQRTGQIQEIARGARNPGNFTPKASPTTVVNSPTSTPRPAIPGASLASGVASLGIGFLVDRYATPYLMNFAQNAGGILSAELSYKLGNISEAELAEALRFIRSGNGAKWGERINQIRKIQAAAKAGKKKTGIQLETRTFTGGQSDGILYYVAIEAGSNGQVGATDVKQCFGPIGGARMRQTGGGNYVAEILCRGIFLGGVQNTGIPIAYDWYSIGGGGTGSANIIAFMNVTAVNRVDGQPEVAEKTSKVASPIVPSAVRQSTSIPTPRTTDKPPEENKAKPNIIIIPAGFPIGVSGNDKTVQVTPSTTSPSTVEIPHPRTIPSDPDGEKKVPPLSISNSNSQNIKLETPGTGAVTINIPGYNPITVSPGTNKPQGALPIQDVQRQYQPVASTATPTKPSTTPTTPTSPTTTKPATTEDLDQFKKDLEKLILTGGLLAGLTPAIQTIGEKVTKIGENTTPESLTTAAAAGTCRTTQPGGCTTKALDDAVGRINQNSNNNANALDAANALANAKQLEQLGIINNKLGEQLPNGGIGAKLSRFINWSVGDRVIGMMSMVASVHNAFMLSNNVGETLFSIFDNLGNIGALIVKPDGDTNIDSKTWVTSNLDSLFSTMLGAEAWKSVKASYRATNNIFSTSSNAYNNLRSIHNDSQELLNMVRRDTADLGNALVEEGVISEDNWDMRDPKIKIKSKVLNRLDNMNRGLEEVDNKLEAIEQVTSTLLNIAQTAKEVRENVDSLNKELSDASKAFKDTRDKAIEALPDFDFDIDDLY